MKIDSNFSLSGQGNLTNSQAQVETNKDAGFKTELEKAFSAKDKEKLKKACKDFEAMMLNMMFKQMRSTVSKSDLVENSMARENFESMLDDELTKKASEGRGIGLSAALYKSLSKSMDNTYKPTSVQSHQEVKQEDDK